MGKGGSSGYFSMASTFLRRQAMKLLLLCRTRSIGLVALAGLSALVGGAACAAGSHEQEGRPSRSSTVIGFEEIRASSVSNALELIQQARPAWLRSRGSTSLRDAQPTLPVIYVGQMSYGSLENLRDFELQAIQEIRFIDARSATTRFGTGHTGGVIQVVLRP